MPTQKNGNGTRHLEHLGLEWRSAGAYEAETIIPGDPPRNLVVAIMQDDCGDSPRDWDDWLGTMVCWHSRYTLGDEQPGGDPDDYWQDIAMALDDTLEDRLWYWDEGPGWARLCNADTDTALRKSEEKQQAAIDEVINKEIAVILPLYLYDHSGITMATAPFSCPWDSGQVGWIYVTAEKVREEYSIKRISKKTRKRAEAALRSEVETYDRFLRGEVYGYSIDVTHDGTCQEYTEHHDSCCGYYGMDCVIGEVNHALENFGVQVSL